MLFRSIDLWTRNKAYKQLYSETSSVREKAQIDVYDNQGICRLSTTSTVVEGRMPTYWGVLRVARIHRDDMIIKNAIATNQDSSILLQAARAVIYEEDVIGYVVVNIKEEHFETLLLGTYDGRNGIAILDEYWEAVYSTKTAKEEDISQVLRKRRMNGEKVKQETDAITFLIKSMENRGLYLVLGRENIFTEDIMHTTVGMIFILASLSLLLCLCVAIFMSAYLTVPIDKLIKAMKKVESGQLEIQIDSEREDELGQLSESFDKMTRELKEYMELRVRQQQELNDSNIAMMQAQLNPHFLYNTLDTMKWVAKANNIPEIATLAASLAKILRVSISDEKFIPLLNEVEIINHYMEIQKIRFDGNFSFDVELPFELEDCLVPKLIIQPIVENAILHGFKDKKEGHIFLNIYKVDNVLYIEVSDDGCGISLDIVKQLNNREKLKGHIGFFNVDTRSEERRVGKEC